MTTLLVLGAMGGFALFISPHLRRESRLVRGFIIAFALAAFARYMIWRIASLPPLDLSGRALGTYGFLILELVSAYLWIPDLLCVKKTLDRSGEVNRQLDWYAGSPPRIDVLIATYNEPWEVLEKTLVGAAHQNYPRYSVWIFDDGNRPWLKEKADELGVGYVTRTDNTHYKAGNLNNGIAVLRSRGIELEFVALLDADFIARPEFLRRTMALMKSEDIGIVQTPQCFYNPDPHQQAFGGVGNWPDEQRAWFDVYLPALDSQGWATCCGTSCLIRASALDEIGGFPTASVCEDTLSSFKMSAKGKKTAFLRERLTVGLAPEGIGEFLSQRVRWLLGGVQNVRFFGPGRGIKAHIDYWLGLWRQAVWGAVPLGWPLLCAIYWFTGVSLVPAEDFYEAISYFGPLILDRLFRGWLFGGRQALFVSDAVWTLLAPFWLKQTWHAVTGAKARFKVTDKAVHRDRSRVHWELLPVHAALLLALLGGLAYTLLDSRAPWHHDGFFQANTALTFYFALTMLAGIAPVFEGPKRRASDRYPTSETVTALIHERRVELRSCDISLGGVLLDVKGQPELPRKLELELAGVGTVRADLVRVTRGGRAALEFSSPEARPALIRKLYFTDEYIPTPERWSLLRSMGSSLRHLFF